jgi:ADP-ribose pyrophosphatase YjhB (NUDIX family)
MYSPTLGYAKMRPAGVESNHFAYHLDQLLKAGYVAKKDRDYSLTNKGKTLADRVSHNKMDVRVQPHIVTSIYIKHDSGKTLMFKHNFQPYLGLYGAPQGRLHYEESVTEAALRELKEKSGLEGVALAHRGMAYIQTKSGDEIISKILSHVFSGKVSGEPALGSESKNGEPMWIDASILKSNQYMPGFEDIEAKLHSDAAGLFFAEIESTMK